MNTVIHTYREFAGRSEFSLLRCLRRVFVFVSSYSLEHLVNTIGRSYKSFCASIFSSFSPQKYFNANQKSVDRGTLHQSFSPSEKSTFSTIGVILFVGSMVFKSAQTIQPSHQDLASYVLNHENYDASKEILIDVNNPRRVITLGTCYQPNMIPNQCAPQTN